MLDLDHAARIRTALAFVAAKPDIFVDGFAAWLEQNPEVWFAFEREADRIWRRGRRHYSARTIVEWLRHETAIAEKGPDAEYKVNGNFVPSLARLWLCHHPKRGGFFEIRLGGRTTPEQFVERAARAA